MVRLSNSFRDGQDLPSSWGLFLSNERSQLEITKKGQNMIYVFFANRIVNIWNSLPSYVVSAETVNCFKNKIRQILA